MACLFFFFFVGFSFGWRFSLFEFRKHQHRNYITSSQKVKSVKRLFIVCAFVCVYFILLFAKNYRALFLLLPFSVSGVHKTMSFGFGCSCVWIILLIVHIHRSCLDWLFLLVYNDKGFALFVSSSFFLMKHQFRRRWEWRYRIPFLHTRP